MGRNINLREVVVAVCSRGGERRPVKTRARELGLGLGLGLLD